VLGRRPVQVDAPPGPHREVARIGGAEEAEPQPVGVVGALVRVGLEEPLGRRVGTDDERDVAQAGEDPLPGRLERHRVRGARAVRAGHGDAGPPERLGEGRSGDVAGVAVAHGVGARDEPDVAPVDRRVVERRPRGRHAVLDEVPSPLAPGVHAHPQDGDLVHHHALPSAGRHFHTTYSCSSSTLSVSSTSSISMPTRRSSTVTPATTWPSTTMRSRSSSTAARHTGSYGSVAGTNGSGGWYLASV